MLELSTQDRTESLALWRERETRVNMAIVNCALNCHNYTLACDLLNDLLRRTEEELEKVKLSAALGEKERVFFNPIAQFVPTQMFNYFPYCFSSHVS